MNQIKVIALNTFREAIRDRVFYSLLFFSIIMIGFSMVLGNLTLGQPEKIIKDFGLGAISIFGLLIAIFVGISSFFRELEKKTIYIVLSKSVSRSNFLLGKYFGLAFVIVTQVTVMSLFLFLLLQFVYQVANPLDLLIAIVPTLIEILLILAIAMFFCSFSTPFLSGLFTLSIFTIGHFLADLRVLASQDADPVFQRIVAVLYYMFPDLERLNYSSEVVHRLPIDIGEYSVSLIYAICYTGLFLVFAIALFERKDL